MAGLDWSGGLQSHGQSLTVDDCLRMFGDRGLAGCRLLFWDRRSLEGRANVSREGRVGLDAVAARFSPVLAWWVLWVGENRAASDLARKARPAAACGSTVGLGLARDLPLAAASHAYAAAGSCSFSPSAPANQRPSRVGKIALLRERQLLQER